MDRFHHLINQMVFCIKTKKYKLIFLSDSNIWELYDLETDPHEKNNLIDKNIEEIKKLQKILIDWITR